MAQYIIRLGDGTEMALEDATMAQVATAVSIIRVKDKGDALIKNP
jgi:hypothetical protein